MFVTFFKKGASALCVDHYYNLLEKRVEMNTILSVWALWITVPQLYKKSNRKRSKCLLVHHQQSIPFLFRRIEPPIVFILQACATDCNAAKQARQTGESGRTVGPSLASSTPPSYYIAQQLEKSINNIPSIQKVLHHEELRGGTQQHNHLSTRCCGTILHRWRRTGVITVAL
eukprot:gene7510-5295_t